MPKITGQTIPPALEALYLAITSPGKVTQGADGTIRLKKNKKKPKKQPKPNPDLLAFRATAEIVWTKLGHGLDEPGAEQFIFDLVRELAVGVINPKYFRRCQLTDARTLETVPTCTVDTNPPPYGYRTPLFKPTVCAYPNGTATTSQPGFHGGKVGDEFHDLYLSWRKLSFDSYWLDEPDLAKRVVMQWDSTITIDTSARGSRPMISLNLFSVIAAPGAPALTIDKPPIMAKTILYWRFKVPPSAAPFYHSYQVRKITKSLARLAKKQGTGTPQAIILDAANRPMMGRGFNNNNDVLTTLSGDPVLWEIKPPCVVWDLSQNNTWTWRFSKSILWTVDLLLSQVYISTASAATMTLQISLTSGSTNHNYYLQAALAGNWSWVFDTTPPYGDGTLPKYLGVRVIDVSCDGSKAILSVLRQGLAYNSGTRGLVLLELTSPTTGTLTTIADTAACNESTYHTSSSDYGAYGIQIDHWWLNPQTIWAWFNEADEVEQVQMYEYSDSPYPWISGYTEIGLKVGNVTLSAYRVTIQGVGQFTANLDGYDDAGRISGWDDKLSLLDRSLTNSRVNPNWNTRLVRTSNPDYYSDRTARANETFYPNAMTSLQPLIGPDGSVRLALDMYHYIQAGSTPNPAFMYPPYYVLSDRYLGKTLRASGVDNLVEHQIITT